MSTFRAHRHYNHILVKTVKLGNCYLCNEISGCNSCSSESEGRSATGGIDFWGDLVMALMIMPLQVLTEVKQVYCIIALRVVYSNLLSL